MNRLARACTSLSTFLFLGTLAALGVGCTPSGAAFLDDLDVEPQGLDSASAGLELVDVALEVDGVPAGRASHVGVSELGELSVTFVAGESAPLLDAILASMRGETVAIDLLAQDDLLDALDVEGASPTELVLTASGAKGAKKHFEVTAKWQAQNLKYVAGGGKAQGSMGTKARIKPEWSLDVPGLDPSALEGFTLVAHRVDRTADSHAAWAADGLTITASEAAYGAADALVVSGKVVPITMLLIDGEAGAESALVTQGMAAKATRTAEQTTIEWAIEAQTFTFFQKR